MLRPASDAAPVWHWPRPKGNVLLALAGIMLCVALWQGLVVLLAVRGDGSQMPWIWPFLWEGTGHLSPFLLIYIPYAALENAPSPSGRWGRFLLIHGAAALLLALLVPPLFLALRHLLWWLAGWGRYDYGPLAFRLPMEWLKVAFWYVLGMGLAMYWRARKEAQAREVREVELRAQLQEARLEALAAQVDPHFLFNALNTISSVMYEDLEKTDRLLASLARMLRDGLEAAGPAWRLAREREHLEAYLDFALARFGERLAVTMDLGEAPLEASVPRFCLQRLVENSLKHQEGSRPLRVDVRGARLGDRMILDVEDDGPGLPDPVQALNGQGTGLRNLRETLHLLSGPSASLELVSRPGEGCRVRLTLPLESGRG